MNRSTSCRLISAAHQLLGPLVGLSMPGRPLSSQVCMAVWIGSPSTSQLVSSSCSITAAFGWMEFGSAEQVVQCQQRIAERGTDVALRGRIGQVALPTGFHQRGRERVQQRAGQLEVRLGVLEADRVDLMRAWWRSR